MMRAMLLLAGAGLMIGSPALAGEQGELSCVADGYTAGQRADIDALLAKVDILGTKGDAALDAIGGVVIASASDCATRFEWSEAELAPAMLFEFGRLMELGFLRHGKLSQDEIATVDALLAKGDRSELWAALEDQLAVGMAGDTDTVSDRNAMLFGMFMLETGLGLDEAKAEQVGVYLAAKAMQRASTRDFTAH